MEPDPTPNGRAYCGARKRQTEGTCRIPAGRGTDHPGIGRCRVHGGNTRSHRAAAEAVVVETKARTLFGEHVDIKPVQNPLEVYADFAGRVISWMDTMDRLVHNLDSPGYAGLTGEQIRAEVQLFERAMDRCNTVLATYAKLNIDERLSRISEAQQQMVLYAIEAALATAEVTGPRALEAKRAAARRLRVVA